MTTDPPTVATLELHRLIWAELERDDAANEEREKCAHQVIDECSQRRKQNTAKRQVLISAAKLYQEYLGAPVPTEPLPIDLPEFPPPESETSLSDEKPKPRARIGGQRYRILHFLREHRPAAVMEAAIAYHTALSAKRVRDQLRADLSDGIVAENREGHYGITEDGLDLMARFETYKRNKNQPLPSLQGPMTEDGGDEDDAADAREMEEMLG